MFKWKLGPVIYQTDSGFISYPSILRTRNASVDKSRYNENVCNIIFITTFIEWLNLISVITEYLLNAIVLSITRVDFDFTTRWNKKIRYTNFDTQCSGGQILMLAIFPRTLYDTLIFSDDNLVLQNLCFRSHIIPIKITGCRHGESLMHRLFTMRGLLFYIILLIIRKSSDQLKSIIYLNMTTKYFCYWDENSLQSSQIFKRSRYF